MRSMIVLYLIKYWQYLDYLQNWLAKLKHCLVAPGFIDLSRENLCDTDAGAVVFDHKARLLL